MNSPTVSIITAVLNGARFIEQTILSVLNQSYPNVEHIIVDGGSTDGTLDIVGKYRDRIAQVTSEPDKGLYDAGNKGMRLATGSILSFLGSDDLLMPWGINCVVEYFERDPQCRWLSGVPSLFDPKGNMIWVAPVAPFYRRSWIRRRFYTGGKGLGPIQTESVYWKRDLMEKVYLSGSRVFDDSMRAAADMDLWCRFAEHADLHQIGTVIAGWRKHTSNVSTLYWEDEARGVRIPAGPLLGAMYSLVAYTIHRWRRHPRLKDMMLT